MIEINLLPWRDKKREQQKIHRVLFSMLGIGLSVGCWIVIHVELNDRLKKLAAKKYVVEESLNKEAAQVENAMQLKNRYVSLLKQQAFFQQLTHNQNEIVEDFKRINSMTESPLLFNEIRYSSKSLILKGETTSVDKLALFVWELDKKNYFSPIRIKRLDQRPGSDGFNFVLTMPIKKGANGTE